MTERERLLKVLNGESVDRPPVICPGGMMNMVTTELMEVSGVSWPQAHLCSQQMAELAWASCAHRCFENVGVPFCMTVEVEALGAKIDLGDSVYEPRVTGYALQSVAEYQSLPDVDFQNSRGAICLEAIRLLKERHPDTPIIGNITGPISVASSLLEPMIFYKELRKRPAEAHAYLKRITEQLLNWAKLQVEAGADVITISDPSGTGEILGPKYFSEYAVKYLNMLVDELRECGVKVIVHICGDMKNVYEQVDQIRADALSFDSVVPLGHARQHLPQRILMGNVSTYTLERGTPEQVSALAQQCSAQGADIISPACGLGTNSPLKNIQAIRQAILQQAQ